MWHVGDGRGARGARVRSEGFVVDCWRERGVVLLLCLGASAAAAPLDLPLIKTATKASPDSASSERSRSRADSPLVFSSLVRKVSATRSAVEAALAVAKEKEAEPAVDKDETAALVEELRTQLEAARRSNDPKYDLARTRDQAARQSSTIREHWTMQDNPKRSEN